MAGPYPCDTGDGTEAAFIISLIETGDQQFLCGPCFGRSCLELAVNILPAEEILSRVGPVHVADPLLPAAERPTRGRSRSRQKTTPPPAAAQGETGGASEMETAAKDG
jgi:hypothetical protein